MTMYNFFPFKKQTKNDHEFSNKNKYGEDETLQLELDDYYKKIRCCNRLYISAEILLVLFRAHWLRIQKKLWEIVPISIVFAQQKATSLANFWLLNKKYRRSDLFSFLLLLPVLGPHLCYFLARFSRIKIEVKFSSNLNAIYARMLLLYCFYLVKWEEK